MHTRLPGGLFTKGGRGVYTKLNNSHKSTEQGFNFPFCCSRFFNQSTIKRTQAKTNTKTQIAWVTLHRMATTERASSRKETAWQIHYSKNPDVTIIEILAYFKGAPHVERFSPNQRWSQELQTGEKNQKPATDQERRGRVETSGRSGLRRKRT